jgi:hypothetical protein
MSSKKEPLGTLKFWEAKQEIVNRMLAKLDLEKLTDLDADLLQHELRQVVDRVCDALHPSFDRVTRDILTNEIVSEVLRGQTEK